MWVKPELEVLLSTYYLNKENFKSFWGVFFSLASAGGVQLTLLLFAGLCAPGLALTGLYFLGKGMLLGLSAHGLFAAGGLHGLAVYWLITWLPELSVLLLTWMLAAYAEPVSATLFQVVFSGGTARQLPVQAQRLLKQYLILLAVNLAFSLAGALTTVFFVRVLL